MTIEEAVTAARKNVPVVYDSPMYGAMLYARIGSIRKEFALKSDVARGMPAEVYGLELLPMNAARSVIVVEPEKVREATPEVLKDIRQYQGEAKRPEVHPELLCEEIKTGRPWGDRKGE